VSHLEAGDLNSRALVFNHAVGSPSPNVDL